MVGFVSKVVTSVHGYGQDVYVYSVTFIWVCWIIFLLVRSASGVSKAFLYTVITTINFYSVLVYLLAESTTRRQITKSTLIHEKKYTHTHYKINKQTKMKTQDRPIIYNSIN